LKNLSDKIYLIGMPGSGKSTIGSELAVELDYHFWDLDVEIEINEGLTIPEIFEKRGEELFRQAERNNLLNLSNQRSSFLMSTGGGTPCFHNGIDFMNEKGITIFINTNIHKIVRHVMAQQGTRPMFKDFSEDQIRQRMQMLLESRFATYAKAQIIIEDKDVNVMAIKQKLLEVIN
jgi:shikimate kinase